MSRILSVVCLLVFTVTIFTAGPARAVDPAAVLGTWECMDADEGMLISMELGEDGLCYLDIYDYEPGVYEIDKKNNRVGVKEAGDEGDYEWVSYQVKGNKLVITEGSDDEFTMEFTRVWKPTPAKNNLAGRWSMVIPDEFADEHDVDYVPEEFIIQFNNDGTAAMIEYDEGLVGEFTANSDGTVDILVEGEVGAGEYNAAKDTLAVDIDGEVYYFNRF